MQSRREILIPGLCKEDATLLKQRLDAMLGERPCQEIFDENGGPIAAIYNKIEDPRIISETERSRYENAVQEGTRADRFCKEKKIVETIEIEENKRKRKQSRTEIMAPPTDELLRLYADADDIHGFTANLDSRSNILAMDKEATFECHVLGEIQFRFESEGLEYANRVGLLKRFFPCVVKAADNLINHIEGRAAQQKKIAIDIIGQLPASEAWKKHELERCFQVLVTVMQGKRVDILDGPENMKDEIVDLAKKFNRWLKIFLPEAGGQGQSKTADFTNRLNEYQQSMLAAFLRTVWRGETALTHYGADTARCQELGELYTIMARAGKLIPALNRNQVKPNISLCTVATKMMRVSFWARDKWIPGRNRHCADDIASGMRNLHRVFLNCIGTGTPSNSRSSRQTGSSEQYDLRQAVVRALQEIPGTSSKIGTSDNPSQQQIDETFAELARIQCLSATLEADAATLQGQQAPSQSQRRATYFP
eukprot:TRINITY_DN16448_c0_g1_i1.p1 TRINITY_DN16448_c0_g1~~TRINITY_DN16448_c0_g1_i1.p1  ORF type:complete len:480 (-),score=69.53 TRINITY_DN16448_c0_g1_i1:109-1548(-)